MFAQVRVAAAAAALAALLFGLGGAPVAAQPTDAFAAAALALQERLSPSALEKAFPGAEETEPIDGRPPALAVKIGGEIVGYVFSTKDTVNATGYSGSAFDLVAGMRLDGTITGAVLLAHHEAIVGRGVPQELLDGYIAGFGAATLDNFRAIRPDSLNRATVSGRAMRTGVQNAARLVHAGHVTGILSNPVEVPTLDRSGFVPMTIDELRAAGSIVSSQVSIREIIRMFEKAGGDKARPEQSFVGARTMDDAFIDLTVTLLTLPTIVSNIYGDRRAETALEQQPEGGLTIFLGSDGLFSFANNSHFQAENDYQFTLFKFVQDDREFRFTRDTYRRMGSGAGFTFRDGMNFYLAPDSGLDPLQPFDVVLMVPGATEDGEPMVVEVAMTYQLPAIHILMPPPEPVPAWVEAWTASQVDVSILAALLLVVTSVFVFQEQLVRRRRLYTTVRVGVLAFTLGWLGFFMGGQLSVVNLWAYLQAPFTGTGLDTFLLDPLIFVLAVYTALTLFVIGRGVFCGWLCPFGALQELMNRIARLLRIPQVTVPPVLQERLWVVKYLAAVVILGLVFFSVELADRAAELEPFKTVISVKLAREWPFVAYALVLLGAGLFVERAYCRFLCPLGGSLGIAGRLRMFDWLKRKPQCGTECRICEADCPLGAIAPSGEINLNECLQCLDCQADYYDDQRCPPLIQRRKRKAARAALGTASDPAPQPLPAE